MTSMQSHDFHPRRALPTSIPTLLEVARNEFDLTEPRHQASLYKLADALLTLPPDESILSDHALATAPLEFRLAVKLVESRRALLNIQHPLTVGIVFAMWGEHNRLLPKSADNPAGEDSLRNKLDQLAWATHGTQVGWTLYGVDDGCPYGSGSLAAKIAASHQLGSRVKVIHLSDSLPMKAGPLSGLKSADDSYKGGSILLGCQTAIHDGHKAIIYTDADNSVHLGQIGILLKPFIDHGTQVVLGNRKDPRAVVVKHDARFGVGTKLLRHMQRMVGESIFSANLTDTQAPFKLYERELLRKIIETPAVYDFSFDTDWILAAHMTGAALQTVPFAFIDSLAESTQALQGAASAWESLLKGLLKALRTRGIPYNREMAQVIEEEIRSAVDVHRLLNHVPPQLVRATDRELGDPGIMPPDAVRAWIQTCKASMS